MTSAFFRDVVTYVALRKLQFCRFGVKIAGRIFKYQLRLAGISGAAGRMCGQRSLAWSGYSKAPSAFFPVIYFLP
ncbi:MAG: hypothetical protein COT35_13140 [Nitrospirae bacterium CG08_land_8_20_14_0_20_52_24]|nr:MAG: hypothetical protein COT35_13140 [Nitrospirae bacterium CG08_land_8_20_14_0_20_52_24]PIW85705.1 MAG: hypothetical protein COZ95_03105 [Nitrospirae bacterium CG_4_8_14_3_um_filter_50_41]PIX84709.1 MAG: hypothetical protein COZ32_12250 [Nitrospirae bacterium CG_4_10_14_3_um_filter_53_41]